MSKRVASQKRIVGSPREGRAAAGLAGPGRFRRALAFAGLFWAVLCCVGHAGAEDTANAPARLPIGAGSPSESNAATSSAAPSSGNAPGAVPAAPATDSVFGDGESLLGESNKLLADPQAWLEPDRLGSSLQMMALMTVLSLAPAVLVMTTSFIRIIIVLGLLRQALGTQQSPPSQVITSIDRAWIAPFVSRFASSLHRS